MFFFMKTSHILKILPVKRAHLSNILIKKKSDWVDCELWKWFGHVERKNKECVTSNVCAWCESALVSFPEAKSFLSSGFFPEIRGCHICLMLRSDVRWSTVNPTLPKIFHCLLRFENKHRRNLFSLLSFC